MKRWNDLGHVGRERYGRVLDLARMAPVGRADFATVQNAAEFRAVSVAGCRRSAARPVR